MALDASRATFAKCQEISLSPSIVIGAPLLPLVALAPSCPQRAPLDGVMLQAMVLGLGRPHRIGTVRFRRRHQAKRVDAFSFNSVCLCLVAWIQFVASVHRMSRRGIFPYCSILQGNRHECV